jgi:hypothetical protein
MSEIYDAASEIRDEIRTLKEETSDQTAAIRTLNETVGVIAAVLGDVSDTLKRILVAMDTQGRA